MSRVTAIVFAALVAATFAAFFVAQRLKSSPPVIRVASLNRAFSPALHPNRFSVTLKTTDDVTVDVVDLDGDRVKRLSEDVRAIAHRPLRLVWNGTTDTGARAPDGQYRIRVSLRNERRDAVERLKKAEKAKEITEDDRASGEQEIQKLTDLHIKRADELLANKERDIMEV